MDCPPTWEEFIENFTILDIEEVYTNGSVLVPLFRVKQMMERYYKPEQTCRNISAAPKGFLCSECGWGDFDEPSHLLTSARFAGGGILNFCPNCGTKVVE